MRKVTKSQVYELIRFGIIGAIAVFIDFIVYFALIKFTFIPIFIAKGTSYLCGASFSFVGHRFLVFNARDKHPKKQVLPFTLLYLSSLIINNILNALMLSLTNIPLLAWFVSIVVAVTWNYFGMKFVVFKKKTGTIDL